MLFRITFEENWTLIDGVFKSIDFPNVYVTKFRIGSEKAGGSRRLINKRILF